MEKRPPLTGLKTEYPDIEIVQVLNGKITEVLLKGHLFAFRDDIPEGLDPLRFANDMFKVFDFKKTTIVRKLKSNTGAIVNDNRTDNRPDTPDKIKAFLDSRKDLIDKSKVKGRGRLINIEGIPFTVVNNVSLFKERAIDIYRKMPMEFKAADVTEYMQNAYPEITESTAKNRARSYLKYFKDEGFIIVGTVGKNTKVYNFIKAPFEAEKPAQSDFNPDILKTQMALELDTMRRA